MVAVSSHLFWPAGHVEASSTRYSDGDKVLECMQRALKIASMCGAHLYVDILERYVRYSIAVALNTTGVLELP